MSEIIKEFKKGDLLHIDKDGKAQWGFPEGYPYKEGSETVIEWDGNIEGLESFGGNYYKVSNKSFTVSELIGSVASVCHLSDGSTKDVELTGSRVSDGGGGTVTVITDGGNVPSIISSDGTSFTEGTYFNLSEGSFYICKLTVSAETIHPIAAEFLPTATPTSAGTVKQAAAVANVTAAPTAEEFNALLKSLRDAGILATS